MQRKRADWRMRKPTQVAAKSCARRRASVPRSRGCRGLLDALRGEMTPKFLATRNAAGVPNVVPCVSIQPADDQPDTVFFGNFLLRKSIKHLKEDSRVGILVVTPKLRGGMLQCDFVEFQRTGA